MRTFADVEEFESWLAAHHAEAEEVWVVLPKKGTPAPSVTRSEALGVALCYGWIDGKATSGTTEEGWWAQRFTPRRPRSVWSKVNRIKAERLIESGRMRPAGLAQVERAKADGRWAAAYDSPSRAQVPEDLAAALARVPGTAEALAALSAGARYAILLNLQKLKRPETRVRRIGEVVARLTPATAGLGAEARLSSGGSPPPGPGSAGCT
jgi:uncharacterized protein YdeI (YjbR/CyaY-like superfamily)